MNNTFLMLIHQYSQGKWSEFLDCPTSKQAIVEALGMYFI